jgi:hypothetical protein
MQNMKNMIAVAILAVTFSGAVLAQLANDKPAGDPMKKELELFKAFIQEHPRALAELKKDPSLIRTKEFADQHQVVGEYLEQHPKIKDELKKYPNFFADLKATTPGGQHKPHPDAKQ